MKPHVSRKRRPDAVLWSLPEDRQAQIAEHARANSLPDTVKWLRQDGVATSRTALSVWLSGYALQQQCREDDATTDTLLEELKREVPNLSDDQLDSFGQRTFSLLAIRRQDADTFVRLRSAHFKAQIEREKLELRKAAERRLQNKLAFEREKTELLAAERMLSDALRKRAQEIATSNLSNAEKIAAMRKAAFADVDAMQASGKVKLPE